MRGLKGKVAVVAGGATGIGAATATRLAEEGMSVIVGDLNITGATAVAAQITSAGGQALAVGFDIADDASVRDLVRMAVQSYGGLDLMHANAADLSIYSRDTNALEVPLDIFDRTIAVNLRGHLLCTRHALPELLKRGGGAIVYTSSGLAFVGTPDHVSYAVAKAGIHALMRHVASRWGKQSIRANVIAPGLVLTEGAMAQASEAHRAAVLSMIPSPRHGQADDIASMVAMLASNDGVWINGQVISIDGGITMR
jgi:NAD(P)-dependent dehydrogenase (short-subunit alcohol dehydrogenase family)